MTKNEREIVLAYWRQFASEFNDDKAAGVSGTTMLNLCRRAFGKMMDHLGIERPIEAPKESDDD